MKTPHLLAFGIGVAALLPFRAAAEGSPSPQKSAAASANKAADQMSPPPAAQPAADAAELTKLLTDFLAGASHNDLAAHDRFWADDLIYTGSSGRRIGKADILRSVREESALKKKTKDAPDETTIYSAEDIRIQQYGTTAIVAFRLVGTTVKGDNTDVAKYFNTGTFLKRDGKWQVVAWQATKIPLEGAPNT